MFDEIELKERQIDAVLGLVNNEDYSDRDLNLKMVRASVEIEYCEEIQSKLKLALEAEIEEQMSRYQQEEEKLISNNFSDGKYIVSPSKNREIQQHQQEQKLLILQKNQDKEIESIKIRFQSLIENVDKRIERAKLTYEKAKENNYFHDRN